MKETDESKGMCNLQGEFDNQYTEYTVFKKDTLLPQQHIISNKTFGSLITNRGTCFTYHINSRENKLTEWHNNWFDKELGETFEGIFDKEYSITYGFGYAKVNQEDNDLRKQLIIFIPTQDNIKVQRIQLSNNTEKEIKQDIIYKIKPVLGVSLEFANKTLVKKVIKINKNKILVIRNIANSDFKDEYLYVFSNAEDANILEEDNAISISVTLKPNETKQFDIFLGASSNKEELMEIVAKYNDRKSIAVELEKTKKYWLDLVMPKEIVETDNLGINIMMKGWLLYQTISCRLYARCSIYQCGGAFGYRDQLQDSMCVASMHPDIAKYQILKNASKQFEEGDVLHWWHEPVQKGIRGRYSDDPLWLAYAISEYINISGSKDILNDKVPYLIGNDKEYYDVYTQTENKYSIYDHAINAINYVINKKHTTGLLDMQNGDWNDGMNNVKGASVWLTIFAIFILDKWIDICRGQRDFENTSIFQKERKNLEKSLMNYGYNGEYFSRIITNTGKVIGDKESIECKIDLMPQIWFCITFAGDVTKREYISRILKVVEENLIDRENRIVKLLTPAFDKDTYDIGYIRKYVPGVRENGGQYTHAVVWLAKAYNDIGEKVKAKEILDWLIPINRIRDDKDMNIYNGEMYAIASDVYSNEEHMGRVGWTYYTGSSAWLYKVIREVYGL